MDTIEAAIVSLKSDVKGEIVNIMKLVQDMGETMNKTVVGNEKVIERIKAGVDAKKLKGAFKMRSMRASWSRRADSTPARMNTKVTRQERVNCAAKRPQ